MKRLAQSVAGVVVVALISLLRHTNPERMSAVFGWVTRTIGPRLRENRIARANIRAAFPEKTPAEVETILRGSWDNLGRVGGEFPHLDRFDVTQFGMEKFRLLEEDGKPALLFGAHLANWELAAVCLTHYVRDSAVLYRPPNIKRLDRWVAETRGASMGELISADASVLKKLIRAVRRGAHVGMLVDQYHSRGVPVTFVGRVTPANPLLARLAQHIDCPIHGVRMIRLPGNRWAGDITDPIEPARDADGKIDIAGTMQIVMSVIEGWIREHPEQWLWQHRRWR